MTQVECVVLPSGKTITAAMEVDNIHVARDEEGRILRVIITCHDGRRFSIHENTPLGTIPEAEHRQGRMTPD